MTIADEFMADAMELILEMGTSCTITEVAGVYSTDGTVAETETDHEDVPCSDLMDEAKRYRQTDTLLRCVGTFYFPASGLDVVPSVGNRITYDSRSFSVLAAFPYRVQGVVVAYRCDVAEAGAA